MRIQPVVASVVGVVSDRHWGQVLVLPHAYGVVEVERLGGDALTYGIQTLGKLTRLLSHPITSLESLEAIGTQTSGDGVVSLLLLVPIGNALYFVLVGDGVVYLKRGGALSLLMSGTGSMSGEVRVGDAVLLGTQGLTRALPQEKLVQVFDHLTPAEVAEKLTLPLHTQEGAAGGASLIFQVEKLVPVEEEIPTSVSDDVAREVGAVAQPVIPMSRRPFLSRVRSFRPHHFSRMRAKLRRPSGSPKRAILVVIVLLLFAGSIVFGLVKQAGNTKNRAVVVAMTQAQRTFDEGMALITLNTLKGREELNTAKGMLEPFLKTTSPRSKEGKDLTALYKQITDAITQSLAVTHAEPQLFYDVSLLKKGAVASSMALTDDMLAIGDMAGHTVYTLTISSKNGQVIAGGESFDGSLFVGIHGETVYVLTGNGIHAVKVREKTTRESVIKKDDQWGSIKSLAAFAGNLYLLDTGKGRIWKYVATESGFTDRREYLNPDTLPDLTKATSMAINGSIVVGTVDGKILRFTQGKDTTFVPQGVESAFGGSSLTVSAGDERVYVLESDKKRVVVLDKDGLYVAQYVWEGNISPSQLVVSETAKKILLLADGKIYSLDLK